MTQKEAQTKLQHFGPNELPKKKPVRWVLILWSQFKSPLIFILFIAAVVTAILNEWVDFGVIIAAVIINTILGFIQELKADRSVENLRRMVEIQARVMRDGEVQLISAKDVAPGDILLLHEGDKIPADARLFEANELETEEAELTGESAPVKKNIEKLALGIALADRTNMVYMGTMVARGVGKAVVTATGLETSIGQLAQLVAETEEEKTPLQFQLGRLARGLSGIVLVIVLMLVILGLLRQMAFFDIFLTAVAVAVAAIPEGLLVSVTAILAIGMQRILQKKALVRKLIAAETLGSVSVICTDKTGTLTEGKMQVVQIVTEEGRGKPNKEEAHHVQALKIAVMANDGAVKFSEKDGMKELHIFGDSTERALLAAGVEAGIDQSELIKTEYRIAEVPFDHHRKFMAALNFVRGYEGSTIYVKGAPEVLLERCSHSKKGGEEIIMNAPARDRWLRQADELTSGGLRVLAVAQKKLRTRPEVLYEEDVSHLTFVGLIALQDPLRQEARETIELCRKAGIHPVLITGDHKLTAKTIAREAGILVEDHRVLTGKELDELTDFDLRKQVEHITVYARVDPKHKLRIVDAWQARGKVVAMTGDGVNDAPALKSADVGVAVGSGSDVTKETADLVLLDNNFKTIVEAIKQGRVIFANIRKIVAYLLSDSFSEMILIGGSLLMGLPLPLLPAQILWINLITDGFPNLALTFEPEESGIMNEPPRSKGEPILNRDLKILIFLIGIITDLGLFAIFLWLLGGVYQIEYVRTMIFAALGLDSLFYVFSIRSLRQSIFKINPLRNRFLVLAVLIGVFLQAAAIYWGPLQRVLKTVPLNLSDWGIVILIGVIKIFAIEIAKTVFRFLDQVREEVLR